jgi:stage II sporulation protein D
MIHAKEKIADFALPLHLNLTGIRLKKCIPFLLFILLAWPSFSHTLKVGILSPVKSVSLIVLPAEGTYEVFGNGHKIMNIKSGNFINIKVEKKALVLRNFDKIYGSYSSLKLVSAGGHGTFRIKSIAPPSQTYTYDDNLELNFSKGSIHVVNLVDLEDYVAGVVEAEAGKNMAFEFLKLQAIICRTYALSLTSRHINDGYQLCDNVHCQVYKGKSRFNSNIVAAVAATKNQVIADANFRLITAAFHSNCGGETVNSEDVWSVSLPYLRAVKDTFCCRKPHAVWEKKIPIYDWKNYLVLKNKKPLYDNNVPHDSFNYNPKVRQINYGYQALKVPLKNMRNDWGLRSTFFNIQERNDSVILKGSGFGHGVGMCQEGAMRMAELGYSSDNIIKFYYKDVGIIHLDNLKFFRQDE